MKMMRSFLPVGQGAFYCERFKLNSGDKDFINVVYDCGSLRNPKRVEKQIKAKFHEGETIHAVFISHLHDDHINGLEFLLKYCNVKNIFFPLTNRNGKTILTLYELSQGISFDDFSIKFIINPWSAIEGIKLYKEPPRIHGIEPAQAYENLQEYDINETKSFLKNVSFEIFGEQNKLSKNWLYIPFNFSFEERANQLFDKLKILLNNSFEDLSELGEVWRRADKKTKKAINDAYAEIEGSHNPNSMTLYSGTEEIRGRQRLMNNCCCKCYYNDTIKNGCLYTGDYDASKKECFDKLKEIYNNYWKNIGCVQIPHHGSIYSYNTGFSEMSSLFVISAGQNNKFFHPHSFVINDLLLNNHYPFVVTEKKDSEIYLIVEVY